MKAKNPVVEHISTVPWLDVSLSSDWYHSDIISQLFLGDQVSLFSCISHQGRYPTQEHCVITEVTSKWDKTSLKSYLSHTNGRTCTFNRNCG